MSVFSENLRRLRRKKGESQAELGEAVGKSRDIVAKYEAGENEPNLDTLNKLSRHFGVPIDSIVTDDECMFFNGNPDLAQFELYLNDKQFVPYMCLAAKIKDSNIDIKDVENYVDSIVKYIQQTQKGKKVKKREVFAGQTK